VSADRTAGTPRPALNPYLVLLIAAVAPGSGHWAAGNIQRGVMFAWFMIILGWVGWRLTAPDHSAIGRLSGGLLIYAISILDAYKLARIRWTLYRQRNAAQA
jgi:hypothetical protein